MVLLVGSDAGSITKGRPQRLSTASSTTLAPSTPATRVSARILLIHLCHVLLVLLCTLILIAGVNGWEHSVEVDPHQATKLASYVSLGSQAFFTCVILLLYDTTRLVVVDRAVRHPRTLLHLSASVYVWSGFPATLKTWFTKNPATSGPFRGPFRSIYLGTPLYIIVGSILQLSASSVLGVRVFASSIASSIDYSASSHSRNYGVNTSDTTVLFSETTQHDLWTAARREMFLSHVNDTQRPGIQASLLHDIPSHTFSFDVAQVNATSITVECRQPEFFAELLLVSAGSTDPFSPTARSQPNLPLFVESDGEIWVNISMSKPPYWDPLTPGLNITRAWADTASIKDNELPLSTFVQSWVYAGDGVVGHHQAIIALVTSDPSSLITDSQGSVGTTSNFTIVNRKRGSDHDGDDDDFTEGLGLHPSKTTAYAQVMGCSMRSTSTVVSMTQSGLLALSDSPEEPLDHTWSLFDWEEQVDISTDRQFLIALSGDDFVEKLIQRSIYGLGENATLKEVETVLQLLTTSYLWNHWQKCSLPSEVYTDDCTSLNLGDSSSMTIISAISPMAHLQIILWRATLSFCTSVILTALAVALLGWRTDLVKGDVLKDIGIARTVQLMQESYLPHAIDEEGLDIPIRYQSSADGKFEHLDYWDGGKTVA